MNCKADRESHADKTQSLERDVVRIILHAVEDSMEAMITCPGVDYRFEGSSGRGEI